MQSDSPIIKKILDADPNTYVIFFTYDCFYSIKALDLLRQSGEKYKGYDIDTIDGGLTKLLKVLNEQKKIINFDPNHRTKPIIFLNGKFIGGYDDLKKYLVRYN